ncbi:Spo0E family sporulation regulatory protein-aspartic acid phosphatase [Candidatus Clostridium radicumherbarum]|uniref:Spo0E family sporulation regulatory protein-aspartic acid phosphatase n=1 Tax=Candidatus Clostridium radicumherbarum TaxID=3381662 RepID=A0ABW8TR36_9CLOT
MSCSKEDLNKKIEGLRATLNEVSATLLESDVSENHKVISISEEMDILINKFILEKYNSNSKK